MAAKAPFNVMIVAQAGRLEYEAVLFAASFARACTRHTPNLIVAEPQPGPRWQGDPRIPPATREMLEHFGAVILPFESRHFGMSYPQGNKIEALLALPDDAPFVFFDTDTLVLGDLGAVPFDFDRPSASMRREGTWPKPELYGPGYTAIWKSLYDRFGLDMAPTQDLSQPDEFWKRYLYFNAGWFFYRAPHAFGERFRDYALSIRDDPPVELASQALDPWLDQVALPLVIHSLGGGRPGAALAGLDGDVTCHYRALPLLYARESDAVVALLEEILDDKAVRRHLRDWEAARVMVNQKKGRAARALFDRANLPLKEQAIRNQLRKEGLWVR